MRLTVGLFMVVLNLAVSQAAQPAKKEPWKWTLEERLAARFDERQRAARVVAHLQRQREHALEHKPGATPQDTMPLDVIDGKTNPELFLPAELFRRFVWSSFVAADFEADRRFRKQLSDDLLLTDAEWEELSPLVAEAVTSYKQEMALVQRQGEGSVAEQQTTERELAALRARQCKTVVTALRAVREHFGTERFDRYLYTVVARPMTLSSDSIDPSTISSFRKREQGCE